MQEPRCQNAKASTKNQDARMLKQAPRTKMPRTKEKMQRTNPCRSKEVIQKNKNSKGL